MLFTTAGLKPRKYFLALKCNCLLVSLEALLIIAHSFATTKRETFQLFLGALTRYTFIGSTLTNRYDRTNV